MGCDISINIDGCYISIFASALSSAFRSLFLDQKLLDAEADLVVGFVEVNDLSCDFLADLEYIGGFLNVLSGDLGDMKQCIDTGLKLYECAEIGHSCYSACNLCSDCILLCSAFPGILLGELQGQSDLGALDILNQDAKILTNLEDLLGILYTRNR